MHNSANKLAQETSPYLLQHADNPVNWYPWGEQALQLAKDNNKPILLSIGYSACHWCHVMAHESFEDKDTAAIMNRHFINIKVDREERPDLDKIYQLSHQVMTGRSGGWPLTLVLSPADQTAFFAGTYFPSTRRHGMRSFSEILLAVQDAWENKQAEIKSQNDAIKHHLQQISSPQLDQLELNSSIFDQLGSQLLEQFDPTHGGFSQSPKFPHPYSVERTIRQSVLYGKQFDDLKFAGIFSALKMAQGGLFDQIGGGFCRYSTDELWMIPHFEKMLYDNGQLMPLYCYMHQLQPDYYFKQAVTLSAQWIMQEMQSPQGGYYSAQDADSEGEEGKFYSWTADQVKTQLSEAEYAVFAGSLGLDQQANFEGKWYPHTYQSIEQIAQKQKQSPEDIQLLLDSAKRKLYQHRAQRIYPGTDDKILTSWNALMIRGMNCAARTFNNTAYSDSASKALQFIKQHHWVKDRLLATSKNAKAHLNAYLDDYAYLALAIIDALQNEWDNELYTWLKSVTQSLLELFEDKQRGGFYFTSTDHEQLIIRSKSFNDDAMPAGNAIAAEALQILGLLSGNVDYLESAEKTLQAVSGELSRQPILYCAMLNALDNYLNPATIIILRGNPLAMQEWQKSIFKHYLPTVWCFAIPDDVTAADELSEKKAIDGTVCAYICEGLSCQQPVTDLTQFQQFITDWINKAN